MTDNNHSLEIIYTDVANIDQSRSTIYKSKEPETLTKNHLTSTMTLINSTVGITILLMPKLFHLSGIVFGTIQLLILALLNFITSYMLCWAGNIFDLKSYFEIGERVFKGRQRYVTHFFYLAMIIGNILCYQTFVLQSLNDTIKHLFFADEHEESITMVSLRLFICVVTNLCILPFLFSRKLKKIKILSKICTLGIFFGIILICMIYMFPWSVNLNIEPINYNLVSYFNLNGLYRSLGVYMLSFCFHLIVVDINHEITPKTRNSTKIMILTNCLVAFLVYFTVSLFGYLTVLEDKDKIDKLSNFFVFLIVNKHNDSFVLHLASFFITVAVLIGNIMNYLPLIRFLNWKLNLSTSALPSRMIEELNLTSSVHDYELAEEDIEKEYSRTYRLIVTITFLIILAAMCFIVIFNIRLEMVFTFVSAMCAAPVCIILPAIFYVYLLSHDYFKGVSALDFISTYTVGGIGVAIWGYSIYALFMI